MSNFNDTDLDNSIPLGAIYGFVINGLGIIFDSKMSSEVIKAGGVCAIPRAIKGLDGVTNIRGQLIPVFDLKILLFNEQTNDKLLLILDKGNRSIALRIQEYPRLITDIKLSNREDAAFQQVTIPELMRDYIIDYYASESQPWVKLDKDAFFSFISK